jgi:hypothetical protein
MMSFALATSCSGSVGDQKELTRLQCRFVFHSFVLNLNRRNGVDAQHSDLAGTSASNVQRDPTT